MIQKQWMITGLYHYAILFTKSFQNLEQACCSLKATLQKSSSKKSLGSYTTVNTRHNGNSPRKFARNKGTDATSSGNETFDLAKTFEKVNWIYTRPNLIEIEIGIQIVNWIMGCSSLALFFILING